MRGLFGRALAEPLELLPQLREGGLEAGEARAVLLHDLRGRALDERGIAELRFRLDDFAFQARRFSTSSGQKGNVRHCVGLAG